MHQYVGASSSHVPDCFVRYASNVTSPSSPRHTTDTTTYLCVLFPTAEDTSSSRPRIYLTGDEALIISSPPMSRYLGLTEVSSPPSLLPAVTPSNAATYTPAR